MNFSFCCCCCCCQHDRASYNLSSKEVYYKNSYFTVPSVTLVSLRQLFNKTSESDYERILDVADPVEIDRNQVQRDSTISMESGGYARITPIQSQPLKDDTPLYSTILKTKTTKNRTKETINTRSNATNPSSILPVVSSSSLPFSSSHPTGITIPFERLPPLLPPYPSLLSPPFQVCPRRPMNGIRHSGYDGDTTHDDLQNHTRRLQMEDEQTCPEQQLRENYYSSANSEPETTISSDIYAEIANGSASGTVSHNL